MVEDTVKRIEINLLHEMEGEFLGDVVGFYCHGHPDKQRFYSLVIVEWEEYQADRVECGYIDEIASFPFATTDIKQCWYRHPTDEELEEGEADSEMEFVLFDAEGEGLTPITFVSLGQESIRRG